MKHTRDACPKDNSRSERIDTILNNYLLHLTTTGLQDFFGSHVVTPDQLDDLTCVAQNRSFWMHRKTLVLIVSEY